MHVQESDKRVVCKEFFQALQLCHSDSWKYWTGGCNGVKHDLNMCLRGERISRSEKNREEAKVRREKQAKAREELHKND